MCKKLTIASILFFSLFYHSAQASQRDGMTLGTRAMGMAGIFSPQSDDSTGVFYNPAGLAMAEIGDFTIEQGNAKPNTNNPNSTSPGDGEQPLLIAYNSYARYGHSAFAAGYAESKQRTITALGFAGMIGNALAAGISYSYITRKGENQSPNSSTSTDFLPMKVGLISKIIQAKYVKMSLTGSYQMIIANDSLEPQASNISATDRLPTEPEGYTFGTHIKIPTAYFLLGINYGINESTYNYDIDAKNLPSSRSEGYSAELHLPLWKKLAVSLRMGYKEKTWSDISQAIVTNATGVGVSYANRHFIDTATETIVRPDNSKLVFTSLSYAYQF